MWRQFAVIDRLRLCQQKRPHFPNFCLLLSHLMFRCCLRVDAGSFLFLSDDMVTHLPLRAASNLDSFSRANHKFAHSSEKRPDVISQQLIISF
jgi:hypothetical protein